MGVEEAGPDGDRGPHGDREAEILAEAVQGERGRISAFTDIPIPALPLATWLRRTLVTLAIWRGRISDRL